MLKMTEDTPNAEYAELALDVIEGSLKEGWDFDGGGGLFYVMDVAGRPLVDQTVTATSKLWWPMTEALIAITMALVRTGDWQRWVYHSAQLMVLTWLSELTHACSNQREPM